MQAETEAQRVKYPANCKFRLCIAALDCRHVAASLFGTNSVHFGLRPYVMLNEKVGPLRHVSKRIVILINGTPFVLRRVGNLGELYSEKSIGMVYTYFKQWQEKPLENESSLLEQALKKSGWRGPYQTWSERTNHLFDR